MEEQKSVSMLHPPALWQSVQGDGRSSCSPCSLCCTARTPQLFPI